MVIHISLLVFLLSAQSALSFSANDVLTNIQCSSSRSPVELCFGQGKASVLMVLETKLNLRYMEVGPDCNAVFQNEETSYSKNKNNGGFGWIRAIWNMVDLLLGQFVLTPVSGASTTWSRAIPKGHLSASSSICNSMREFRRSLVGFRATGVVVSAGSTSIKCLDTTIAKQIVDRFSSISTSKSTFICNGKSWSVGTCGGGTEISVSVGGQGNICSCSGNTVVIRPCINNINFGGLGSKACNSPATTLRITVYSAKPTLRPTAQPTLSPTPLPTETPTTQPTLPPTNMPTETPTPQPTLPPSAMPTETPTAQPTTMPTKTPTSQPTLPPTAIPTKTPTNHPTTMPTQTPSALPTLPLTSMPTVNADLIRDFDIIDKNGDGSLNYDEIVFAIADINKDQKLSLNEYKAARAATIFIDTKYTLTNSSVVKTSHDLYLNADFHTIDRNGDGFLNYDEIAFAIVDTKKNGKLSLEEYEAARADRIFVDTSYKPE